MEGTLCEITAAETALVGGADFSWAGLRTGMAEGFVEGAWFGGTAFGFANLAPGALIGGFTGSVLGGMGYVLDELID